MEELLKQLEEMSNWKNFIKTHCRRNGVDTALANAFTVRKMRQFSSKSTPTKIDSQIAQTTTKQRIKSAVWLQNELKAFQWLLVAASGLKAKLIENFDETEWREMASIFNKSETVLQYEAIKLVRERQEHKRKWEEEEEAILKGIVKDTPDNNKWNEIARKLFEHSNRRYFRSGKQCRERWLNHLDPEKKHGQWEEKEDRFIVEYILGKGRRWSEIGRKLEKQRTEHMIKNRYKTLLIRLKKKYPEIKGESQLLQQFLNEEIHDTSKEDEKEPNEADLLDVPVESEGEAEDDDEQGGHNEDLEKVGGNLKQFELHQVSTPCPVIYQTFTPTFLNTPNALPLFMNYSFGQFQKNENLFLKNS